MYCDKVTVHTSAETIQGRNYSRAETIRGNTVSGVFIKFISGVLKTCAIDNSQIQGNLSYSKYQYYLVPE